MQHVLDVARALVSHVRQRVHRLEAARKQTASATVVQRMNAGWTATTDPGILDGSGGIEVRFGLATQDEKLWTSVMCPGNATQAYLPGVQFNKIYMVKVRGFNFVSTGKWSTAVLHKVGGVSIAVDTSGLVPSAATVAQNATSASGSITASPNVSGSVDICTLSWTNNTSATVPVQIEGTIQASSSITGSTMIGFAQVQHIVTTASSGGPFAPVILFGSDSAVGTPSPKQLGAGVLQVNLVAGDTVTALFRVSFQNRSGLGTGTTSWVDASLRLTAIKR